MNRRLAIKFIAGITGGLMVGLTDGELSALEKAVGSIPADYIPFLDVLGLPLFIVKTEDQRLRLCLDDRDGNPCVFTYGPDREVGNFSGVMWNGDPAVKPQLYPMRKVGQ